MWRCICLLPIVFLTLQTSAQPPVHSASDSVPFPTSTHRPLFTAVNAPSCAQEFADAAKHISTAAVDIIYQTGTCAYNLGWYGDTPYGPKQTFPFHNGRACANLLVDMLANFAALVGDIEAAAFDCFNNNQACGQSIAHTAQSVFEGTSGLILAADFCQTPGGTPPYVTTGYDIPTSGFFCWAKIVRFGQRLLKASKFIDVAISVCDTTPPMPMGGAAAAPTPTGDNSTNSSETPPTPTADGAASSSESPPTPTADGAASSSGSPPTPMADGSADSTNLGASWSSLQQPEPFKMVGQADAVERRLSMAATLARSEGAKSVYERLDVARSSMLGFLEAFGVDNMTAADEFEDLAPLVAEFWESFTASHAADPTTPISV